MMWKWEQSFKKKEECITPNMSLKYVNCDANSSEIVKYVNWKQFNMVLVKYIFSIDFVKYIKCKVVFLSDFVKYIECKVFSLQNL